MAVIKMNFLSKSLNMQTNITICLPSFSFADIMQGRKDVYVPGMKYQTLWLLHGHSGDDSDYLHFSNIVRYADDHKVAVVMAPDFNAFYADKELGAKYFSFIVDELPQMCRVLFPLSDKREDNIIGGLSMGGHGAMKCAILRPEQYATALCMSGSAFNLDEMIELSKAPDFQKSMFYGIYKIMGDFEKLKGTEDDVYYHLKQNVEQGKPLPKFFFTCGDKDMARVGIKTAMQFLNESGYETSYEEVPGYGHEWDFWDLSLRKAFKEWFPIRHSAIYPE